MPHDQPVVAVEADDGHRFELIDVAPDSPARTIARIIVLLPGLGISARHYIDFARQLARAGRARVLIHEWRGNGSSNRRPGRHREHGDWGYRELLELDLTASMSAANTLDSRPVWLVGHSLGAQMACLLASRAPRAVAGLVLIASGSPYPPAFPLKMRLTLNLVLRLFPLLSGRIGHFPGKRLGFAGTEAHQVMADWGRTGLSGHYDLPSLSWNPETELARLELPLMTLRMAEDAWVPTGSLNWLLAKMPAVSVQRATVTSEQQQRRADHFNWLRAPGASAAEIAGWLERVSPGKSGAPAA